MAFAADSGATVEPSEPPEFSRTANGEPSDWWNDIFHWGCKRGHKFEQRFADAKSRVADVAVVLRFLEKRHGPDGRPVLEKLGPPTAMGHGWARLPLLDFEMVADQLCFDAELERAWHGTPLEALYAILYHGRLVESRATGTWLGRTDLGQGVYVHNDITFQKAENYAPFVALCDDGIFWQVKFEVMVDRTDRVPPKRKTDQWCQRARSVELVALWVCGRTKAEMRQHSLVALAWRPELEANPISEKIQLAVEADRQTWVRARPASAEAARFSARLARPASPLPPRSRFPRSAAERFCPRCRRTSALMAAYPKRHARSDMADSFDVCMYVCRYVCVCVYICI